MDCLHVPTGTAGAWTRIRLLLLLAAIGPAGCNEAPSQAVLGSFFPAWLLCGFAGVAVTVVGRVVLGAAGLDLYVKLPFLTYLCTAVAVACFTWLFRFGQ